MSIPGRFGAKERDSVITPPSANEMPSIASTGIWHFPPGEWGLADYLMHYPPWANSKDAVLSSCSGIPTEFAVKVSTKETTCRARFPRGGERSIQMNGSSPATRDFQWSRRSKRVSAALLEIPSARAWERKGPPASAEQHLA